MATTLLHHSDPLLLSFDAEVIERSVFDGRPSVILDRTAFYPESGGQMADRGVLGGQPVVDVQLDDSGRVHHVLQGSLPEVGTRLGGEIDRARRRTFMALHTAQHMLSRALIDVARAETVSARLGEASCTVDLSVPALAERELDRAAELVSAVIEDDVQVRAWFPEPGELEALPLRRRPKVAENIRVVQIGELDVSPCGGTHCTRTAQVGLLEISGIERYKGMIRVTFDAGRRARAALAEEARVLRKLAQGLTCGPHDVPGVVDKLRSELASARQAMKKLGERAAGELARELVAASPDGVVVAVLDGADKELLRAVATRITSSGDKVALLAAADGDGVQVVAARGPESSFDCGALIKRVAQASGGKGGGKADRAEGRLPKGVDWIALAALR